MAHEHEPQLSLTATDQSSPGVTRYHHPQKLATICGHEIHASAPDHTPYCPWCVLTSANQKVEEASETLLQNGGQTPPGNQRDGNWKKAKLTYNVAVRRVEKMRKKDQLRWERELAWDEAHLQADIATIEEDRSSESEMGCSSCVSAAIQNAERFHAGSQPGKLIYTDIAWWERPDALVAEEGPSTPPRTPQKKGGAHHVRNPYLPKGSPNMRRAIRGYRAALLRHEREQEVLEMRYRTELAVRRKHQLSNDTMFEDDFWHSPISGVLTRQNHQNIQDGRRMEERRRRGHRLRPRPARSSLSYFESVDELDDDGLPVDTEVRREQEEREMMERLAKQVGTEVGYLYFVGGYVDGLEEWREDYLRSNHELIWRDPMPDWEDVPPQELPEMEMEMEIDYE